MQQRNTLSLLEAASPFELRVDQGKNVPENDVRAALRSGDVGFLHSFTTGSAVDGPGIRLVAWTASCMFRCQYCHNPDTWTLANGIPVTIGRALGELRKYTNGLRAMKGGFTLSGGEPLMQHRFAVKLFAIAKSLQLHTAIETNGYYGDRLSDAELADIDLVILDMKALSPDRHKMVTGGRDVEPVIEFCLRLAELRRPMWFRYVLVPDLTDDPEEMERVANFAADLGVVQRAEVLPFHQMGKFKWEKLGLDYGLANTPTPSVQELANALWIFRNAGLDAD
ncbi:MAG: pyruvate formate-lyase-activating protein [Allosphingosinicella sp.]